MTENRTDSVRLTEAQNKKESASQAMTGVLRLFCSLRKSNSCKSVLAVSKKPGPSVFPLLPLGNQTTARKLANHLQPESTNQKRTSLYILHLHKRTSVGPWAGTFTMKQSRPFVSSKRFWFTAEGCISLVYKVFFLFFFFNKVVLDQIFWFTEKSVEIIYRYNVVHQIARTKSSCKIEIFCMSISNSFLLLPIHGNHFYIPSFYESEYFRSFI